MIQKARHLIFHGRVQGVGFRFTTRHIAAGCDLTGWVRNLPNGCVEMIIQGNAEDIEDCVRDIEESFSGYITDRQIDAVDPDPRLKDFRVTF
jgi:acylphosphatase